MNGQHDDLDVPPQIPKTPNRRDSLTEALTTVHCSDLAKKSCKWYMY